MIAKSLFTEGGKLRQSERPIFPTSVLISGVLLAALGVVIYLEVKNPAKDNTVLDGMVFGFAFTWAGQLRSQAKTEQIKETNHGQNVVLTEIADKVNGGTDKLIAGLRAEHAAAVAALKEEFRIERHDLMGKLNAAELTRHLAEKDAQRTAEVAAVAKLVSPAEPKGTS